MLKTKNDDIILLNFSLEDYYAEFSEIIDKSMTCSTIKHCKCNQINYLYSLRRILDLYTECLYC